MRVGDGGVPLNDLTRRYAAAEREATAALAALNASCYGDPGHEAALDRYTAARAALGAREMIEEAERQRPGMLAYVGAQVEPGSPKWYRQLLADSASALARGEYRLSPSASAQRRGS